MSETEFIYYNFKTDTLILTGTPDWCSVYDMSDYIFIEVL